MCKPLMPEGLSQIEKFPTLSHQEGTASESTLITIDQTPMD